MHRIAKGYASSKHAVKVARVAWMAVIDANLKLSTAKSAPWSAVNDLRRRMLEPIATGLSKSGSRPKPSSAH